MKDLHKVTALSLEKLRENGADMAQCSATYAERQEFTAELGEFSLLRTLFDTSLSLTGFQEHRKGTASLNRLDEDAIAAGAAECMASAKAADPDEAWNLAPAQAPETFHSGIEEPDLEAFFARLRELIGDIKAKYPAIRLLQVIATAIRQESVYRNSNGVCWTGKAGGYSLSLEYNAMDGEETTSFFYTTSVFDDLSRPLLELDGVDGALADTVRQLHPTPLEGKFIGTVILTPDCLNDMLSSIVGNFLSDTVILSGTSPWRDKLGQQVADERISLCVPIDDPRIVFPDYWTGEGYKAENQTYIEKGVLKAFCLSDYVSRKTGEKRAVNSSDSYVLAPGDVPLADLIAGVERGLLVGRFSGGSPAGNGEFSGVAKNSFLIENGKVTRPLVETMISGNLADLLGNVRGISREVIRNGMTVLPWLASDGVNISGK